ncbi:PLDc_N domain-containing protein [Candidatus Saccharibacteria bacterium]|nr:PLDc_N domain-containing protein [Candidatus Saccharibacteria bacterium]
MARRRRRSKKWVSWLIILILLVAAGVVVYLVWDNYFNDRNDDGVEGRLSDVERVVRKEDKKEKNDEKVEEEKNDDGENVDNKKVVQYEGEDPNKAEELSGVVTYAGVLGNDLMIRVNIDQYLSGGSCGLSLIRDDVVQYSNVVNVVDSAATATCEGFNVPIAEIGSGSYQIIIKITSGEKVGVIRGEVNV